MSAPSSTSSPEISVVIFFVILIFVIARRIYRSYAGVRISPARTIGYTVFYFAFGAFFVLASFFEGVTIYYVIPDAALLIFGIFSSHRLTDSRIKFWKPSNDAIFYKGGIIIYLIYVAGLIARLTIEFIFIGPSAFTFTVVTLSQTAIIATAIADMLLTFGIGLLVGRNIRVYQRYKLIVGGKETIEASS